MDETDTFAPFWGHMEDLRRTLLRVLAIICTAMIFCFAFYDSLISWLTHPLLVRQELSSHQERLEYVRIYNHEAETQIVTLPENSLFSQELSLQATQLTPTTYAVLPGAYLVYAAPLHKNHNLLILSPLEGMWMAFKISLWAGIFLSCPLWLFVLSQFFIPGLRLHEKRLILPFIVTSIGFITVGCLFAFLITIPFANQYLFEFNQRIGVNLWSLSHYLDYTLFLLMANGIAFELGAIGIFAIHLKGISAESLMAKRRVAIVIAFILAAVLTPPDVLTQFMLAIPLIGLYEALIVYAKLVRNKSFGQ